MPPVWRLGSLFGLRPAAARALRPGGSSYRKVLSVNTTHISGYPRIGAKRELKFAVEKFWKGEASEEEVLAVAKSVREANRRAQIEAGLDLLPVNDFSLYDHVLDAQVMTGCIPERFGFDASRLTMDQYFQLARGNKDQPAIEMTKWFDTNYHYLVPEFSKSTTFSANPAKVIAEAREAKAAGVDAKPTLLGPVTLLRLGKVKGESFDRLSLLPALTAAYQSILRELGNEGVVWAQLDEPILAMDLEAEWLGAFASAYKELAETGVKIVLGTYFGSVEERLPMLKKLPVNGLHIDCVRAPEQMDAFVEKWPDNKALSLGVIDGRNVWAADLRALAERLKPVARKLGNNLWLSTGCSLLHAPQDLDLEEKLDPRIKQWMAFAKQKLGELAALKKILERGEEAAQEELKRSDAARASRAVSELIHRPRVKERLSALKEGDDRRAAPFAKRIQEQRKALRLPTLPTTTIGSFPQTKEIRQTRAELKAGKISQAAYATAMKAEIAHAVKVQEDLGLDVLVHGEAERNDMVEYFGELLDGYAFTQHGWVQSYGSRCVKPPIIFGDVDRPKPMTVEWIAYAQSLTDKPMKGMLTGPVTMLQWSFARDDIPRSVVCEQIALALNEEVRDLERAGIQVIQIDEPAIREGLPLRRKDWDAYLQWAGRAFRLTSKGVKNRTQIHTHMCYSEFNDILPAIAAMDADVITIETSRSDMELLDAFAKFKYPNDIGPGVYDIHSPRVPKRSELAGLVEKALRVIPAERLWINPDCGLKTRGWEETVSALRLMVAVAKEFRQKI